MIWGHYLMTVLASGAGETGEHEIGNITVRTEVPGVKSMVPLEPVLQGRRWPACSES